MKIHAAQTDDNFILVTDNDFVPDDDCSDDDDIDDDIDESPSDGEQLDTDTSITLICRAAEEAKKKKKKKIGKINK